MVKFAFALSLVLSAVVSKSDAHSKTPDVAKAALNAIRTSSTLQKKEAETRRKLQSKVLAAAQPKSRALENNGQQQEWQDMDVAEYGFCINEYSVKYTGCQSAQSYSDNMAADDTVDGVLQTRGFATFRLCPSDSCSSSSKQGCSSNYGEYVVDIGTYLEGLIAAEEERVSSFCNYCNYCAGISSAKSFISEVTGHRVSVISQAESAMATWVAEYQANQEANGNGYTNGNGQYVAYGDDDYKAAYWQVLRSNGNYANNYQGNGNNNGNNGNGNGNGNWWQNDQSQFWSSSSQQQQSNYWNNMGTWYGRQILNGYFGEDGVFYEGWGYFSAYDGEFHLLSDEEPIFYDPALFGEMPNNWDEEMFELQDENGDEVELQVCSSEDLSSCSGQYDSCMQIIGDADYETYMQDRYGENYEVNKLSDFVQCTPVDADGYQVTANEQAQDQAYANYQANKNQQACEGDNCQQMYNWQGGQKQLYVGPHCGSDGHTISLSVFSDAYCSTQESGYSVSDVLTYDPMQNVDLLPHECVSCQLDSSYQNKWNVNAEGDEAAAEDEENQSGISTMCAMLFQVAGKCHRNLSPRCSSNDWMSYGNNDNQGGDYSMMQSDQQASNEESVCNYIDTLKSGTYSETGEIFLGNDAWAKGWRNPANWKEEYNIEKQAMGAGRKAALAIGALAVVAMAAYACFLHGALARKNIPWRPRRTKGEDPMDVARQSSGIVMGRSRSGPANAPLI